MMDILMSETCWAHKKWNKIASDIKLVFYSTIIYARVSQLHSFPQISPPKPCIHLSSPLPHTRFMPRSSHSSRFYHLNNIVWAVHIIKLLVMQSLTTIFSEVWCGHVKILLHSFGMRFKCSFFTFLLTSWANLNYYFEDSCSYILIHYALWHDTSSTCIV